MRAPGGVPMRHSRGREVAYEIAAAAKARGAGPRKYAEGDSRRAGVNPLGSGNSGRTAKMWPATYSHAEVAANDKAKAANKTLPYRYAAGTYRLDPSDTRPRSMRRQSYRIDAAAVAA